MPNRFVHHLFLPRHPAFSMYCSMESKDERFEIVPSIWHRILLNELAMLTENRPELLKKPALRPLWRLKESPQTFELKGV